MFRRVSISELPFELCTLDSLRKLFFAVGSDAMHMTLRRVEGGFVMRAHVGHRPNGAFSLKTEKSGNQRVFKSVEPAFRVCRQLGLSRVQVEL